MSHVDPNPFEAPAADWTNGLAARPDGIQYLECYRYVFQSPDWLLNVLFVLICQFIPVIGPIVVLGYQFQIVEELTRNPAANYPRFSFDLFVEYLKRGVWPFLVSLVVSMVVVVPVCLVLYALLALVFLAAAAVEGEGGVVVVVLGLAFVGLAVVLVSAGTWIVLMPMILRAGLAQDFAEAFRLDFLRSFVAKVWKELLLGGLFLVASGWVVAGIGALVFCVGVYFAAAVITLAQAHLFYQLYQLFLTRGGKPIPLKIR